MTNPTGTQQNKARDEITVLLDEWTTAETDGDTDALDRQLADDFTGIGPLGFTLTKHDWIDRHATGALGYDSLRIEQPEIRVDQNAAVVTGSQRAEGHYQGHPLPSALRTTLLLTRAAGRWQLLRAHMSFIAGTPGAPPVPGRS